jgi:hypothetical protein
MPPNSSGMSLESSNDYESKYRKSGGPSRIRTNDPRHVKASAKDALAIDESVGGGRWFELLFRTLSFLLSLYLIQRCFSFENCSLSAI